MQKKEKKKQSCNEHKRRRQNPRLKNGMLNSLSQGLQRILEKQKNNTCNSAH